MRSLLSTLVVAISLLSVSGNAGYEWRGGSCFEVTPSGAIIRSAQPGMCKIHCGTHYEWRGSSCFEATPSGALIRKVETFYCRR
jgi:hypothetical protein